MCNKVQILKLEINSVWCGGRFEFDIGINEDQAKQAKIECRMVEKNS